MTNWKQIETSSDKSKNSAQNSDDSLNDEMLDLEDATQEEMTDDEDTSHEEGIDLSDEDVLLEEGTQEGEESSDEEQTEDDSASKKKPSRAEIRIRELVAEKKASDDARKVVEERLRVAEGHNTAYQKHIKTVEKQNIDADIASTTAALERVKIDLKAAVEAGDTDALIKGQEALSENKVKLMALQSTKSNFEAEQKRVPAKEVKENSQESSEIPPAAKEWLAKNGGWFQKNHALTGAAVGINDQLILEGGNVNSPEFYAELDRRLAPYKPKQDSSAKTKSGTETQKQKGTQTMGASSKTLPQKSVKVTPQDAERARRMGIDPKVYLRQKAEYERNQSNSVQTFKPIFINKDKK